VVLLHSGSFTKARAFLLNHSAAIVQDDSGIPFAYFDPKKWRLQAFGMSAPSPDLRATINPS
jgi:hypothetical protein